MYDEDAFSEYANLVIDVYDIDAWVAAETDGQFESHDYRGGAAILIRPDGSGCILDYEAVGYEFKSVNDIAKIGIHEIKKPDENGTFYISMIATHRLEAPYSEIMDNAPVTQMTVNDFFTKRNYNSRCQRNFAEICDDGFFEAYF